MKRAIGYCRYSTALQHETTIAAQIKAITEYCARSDLQLVGMHTDEARTGTNTHRPGFQQLLADARAHRTDAIVVYDISRGSRDVVDWLQFRQDMRNIGVEVHSVTEHLGDVSDPYAFLAELVTVGMGQTFVLQSRQKSIDGKRIRAERGLFCGGLPPLGYTICDGKYEIVPHEAAGVREAFEMYAHGASYNDICDRLREMGIRGHRGQVIGNNTLYFILGNERYTGRFAWFEREERYMHKHVGRPGADPVIRLDVIPRIVDDATWQAVQQRRAENKHNRRNHGKRSYLLSGLIRCAQCGGAYIGFTTRVRNKYEYTSYGCNNKRVKRTCSARNVKAETIEKYVVTLLREVILNPPIIEAVADMICEDANRRDGGNVGDLKRQIARLRASNREIVHAIEMGMLNEELKEKMFSNDAKIKALTEELARVDEPYEVDRAALIAQLSADAALLLEDPASLQSLVRKYILDITVSDEEIVVRVLVDQNAKKVVTADAVTTAGSPGKTRTYNTPVNSRVLCH